MHPQAKFVPISPDLDLHALVQDTPNFEWASHISASEIFVLGQQQFEKLVSIHVIDGGKPLVIKDWNEQLPSELFSAKWLEETYNRKREQVWDINDQKEICMTMGHYLRSLKQLTDQWTPQNFRDERRQRLYLKDIDCPSEWQESLSSVLPRLIFYLNEDIEGGQSRINNNGNRHNFNDDEDQDMFVDDWPTARAGDLMSSLPPKMRAENLMCYIGHEGTYTPAHREMCASLGQNIMIEASGTENGDKPGSSIWFMTETKDREVVSEYFLSMLGHDVEVESHFAQINAWKKAAFPVYIVEQKVGDLILVPPLAPHQVWNRGTRTIKVAWNRTVVETLEMALHEALPKARLVCRDEQYKNKAIIYYTLQKYYQELEYAQTCRNFVSPSTRRAFWRKSFRTAQVVDDFIRLFRLYTEIIADEILDPPEKVIEFLPFDSNITCSYCRSNIFNRFLTCKHCVRALSDGDGDTYDVCMECYAMGRSCTCLSGLIWCEQWPWEELVKNYDKWRAIIVSNDSFADAYSSPPPPEVARLRVGKKPVAQICQEQLQRRPFCDMTKSVVEKWLSKPEDPEVDDNGSVVKNRYKNATAKESDTYRCHVCCRKDYCYRLAFCTAPGCSEAYCYGVLYRGFDLMPQTVMQQDYWKCPRCMEICNCGACRRMGITKPYIPKGTFLGHDTSSVADDRSVELLINFRLHNLRWLQNGGEEGRNIGSKRLRRLRKEADAAKAWNGYGVLDDRFGSVRGGSQKDNYLGDGPADRSPTTTADAHIANSSVGTSAAGQRHYQARGHEVSGVPSRLHDKPVTSHSEMSDDYPDPLAGTPITERTFGRAYYINDDDSLDKILFESYHEPALDSMVYSPGFTETLSKDLESQTHKHMYKPLQEKSLLHDNAMPKHKIHEAAPDSNFNLDPALLCAQNQLGGANTAGKALVLDSKADHATGAFVGGLAATASGAFKALTARATAAATAESRRNVTDNGDKSSASKIPAKVLELRHVRPEISHVVDLVSDDEADDDSPARRRTVLMNVLSSDERALSAVKASTAKSTTSATTAAAHMTPTGTTVRAVVRDAGEDENAMQIDKQLMGPLRKRGRATRSVNDSSTSKAHASTPSAKRLRPLAAAADLLDKSSEDRGLVSKPHSIEQPARRTSFAGNRGSKKENDYDNGKGNTDTPVPQKRKAAHPPRSSVDRTSLAVTADTKETLSSKLGQLSLPSTKFMSLAERKALKVGRFTLGGGKKSTAAGEGYGESDAILPSATTAAPRLPLTTNASFGPAEHLTPLATKSALADVSTTSHPSSLSKESSNGNASRSELLRGTSSSRGRGTREQGRSHPVSSVDIPRDQASRQIQEQLANLDSEEEGDRSGNAASQPWTSSVVDSSASNSGLPGRRKAYYGRRGRGVFGRDRGRVQPAGQARQNAEAV
ncbi:hypothetical protein SEPCBS57363_005462 [Sporothrix epigloea]|uniref:JmjC domain-containing protein n=1 Tax=Sporothrix epigloea TaxID=1892477 RepID=A0ABP0E0P6_9PEZI